MLSPIQPPSSGKLLRQLVKKELQELYQSPRFVVTYAVVSILVLLAFGLAGNQYLQLRQEHEAARAAALRQLDGLTEWGEVEPLAQRPPTVLESLVNGVTHDIGREARVRPGASVVLSDGLYAQRPLLALWRFLDLDFIFRVVLSLFAVLFAFDAVSGEKERGTLRLAMSNAVPRHVFMLGKMVGAFVGIALPLMLPLIGGTALLLVQGVPMTAADGWRLAGVILAGYLYVAAFLGLSLWVSSRCHRSATAFLVLLVVWIGVVLVVPRAAVLVAGRTVEVPSSDGDAFQRARLSAQLFREDQQAMAEMFDAGEGEMRFEINLEEGEDPATHLAALQKRINESLEARQQERRRRMDALDAELALARGNAEARRNARALGLARLSPAATFSLAASALAGSSLDIGGRFKDQVRAYRDSFGAFLKEKIGTSGGGIRLVVMTDEEGPPQAQPIDPAELPRFEASLPSATESAVAAAPDLLILFLFSTLFFVAAFVSFLRYDLR